MPRLPFRVTQFEKDDTSSWHYKWNGAYVPRSGDKVIRVPDDLEPYIRIIDRDPKELRPRNRPDSMKPKIRYFIHFKGTRPSMLNQWKENYVAAFRGQRVPQWDRAIEYVRERYGYDSRNGRHFSHPDGVHYTGFSRGSALSMYLGGSGYGLGANPFPAYPPAFGADHHKVHDWYALYVHDWLLTEHMPGNMEASQSDMGVYGKRPADETAVIDDGPNKKPLIDKEEYIENTTYLMPADDPRNPWNYPVQMRRYRDGRYYFDVNANGEAPRGIEEWDGTRGPAVPGQSYGNYDDLKALANSKDPNMPTQDDKMTDGDGGDGDDPLTPPPASTKHGVCGDFSGLVSTFLNPTTGRIIGYKGLRSRKRSRLQTLEQYSPFWKDQHTPTTVFVAPSQAQLVINRRTMAPFNRRQIGYIQAIAGRQQHRTLKCGQIDTQISSDNTISADKLPQTLRSSKVEIGGSSGVTGGDADAKSLLLWSVLLDNPELAFDARAAHNNGKLEDLDFSGVLHGQFGFGEYVSLNVFDAPCKGTLAGADGSGNINQVPVSTGQLVINPEHIPSTVRATEDGFLNSTDVRFRFTLPRDILIDPKDSNHHNPMGQDHYEFRWIVWRSKKPTMHWQGQSDFDHTNLDSIRDGKSFRNPGYDFFMGQTGRKRGFLGYTLNTDLDKEKIKDSPDGEAYSGKIWNGTTTQFTDSGATFTALHDDDEKPFTVDDLLTARINKDDYVVMKDVRFFLGKEHGKSHFEDNLHWDWNDPIETPEENVLTSPTLNNKNYRWHMTLLGTSGGKSPCALNVCCRWTTKMESG